jgi:hypothetical protein
VKQIAKSWGRGIPSRAGQYLFAEAPEEGIVTNERLGRVMVMPNGEAVAFVGTTQITLSADLVHFGPIPSLERSLATKDRRASVQAD